MLKNPERLYDVCIKAAVCRDLTKKDHRSLPTPVLFDFYYKLHLEKKLCFLALEFQELDIFVTLLSLKHQRIKLLRWYQSLIDHGSKVGDELIRNYETTVNNKQFEPEHTISVGSRIAVFFNEGGWYPHAIEVFNIVEKLANSQPTTVDSRKTLLDIYRMKIFAEAMYCQFTDALETFKKAHVVIEELEKEESVPNLAGLYSNFSMLYSIRSEYDTAYEWAVEALKLLNEDLPPKIIIEVLRQASKSCVVKRRFHQAGLLIRQAVTLATNLYGTTNHPQMSDVLLDYGFFLINYDSIQKSVEVYKKALNIRKAVFDKYNINVALAHEDVAYALYVNEYTSGRFYHANENADRSIRIMERILPKDHIRFASIKRVKALILEEIALDLRENYNYHSSTNTNEEYLEKAEQLHQFALDLSYKAFGEMNVQTAKHYGNLGRLYQTMRLYQEAEKMHLRSIEIKEKLLGKVDYEVGLSVGHLASLYNYHMGQYQNAERLYKRSIAINLNLFGETYSGLEYDYRGLVHVYNKLKNPTLASSYNMKMSQWQQLRKNIKHEEKVDDLMPLKTLLKTFFQLNSNSDMMNSIHGLVLTSSLSLVHI